MANESTVLLSLIDFTFFFFSFVYVALVNYLRKHSAKPWYEYISLEIHGSMLCTGLHMS